MKYWIGLLLLLVSACSSPKAVIEGRDLSNRSLFENKTGFISVVETSTNYENKSSCKGKYGTFTLVSQDLQMVEVPFYPNSVFASFLPPGFYRFGKVQYLCGEENEKSGSAWGFESYQDDVSYYVKIPHDGFCKLDISVKDSRFYLEPGMDAINRNRSMDTLAINLLDAPECLIYSDGVFDKTEMSGIGREANSAVNVNDFEWRFIGGPASVEKEENGVVSVKYSKKQNEKKQYLVAEAKKKMNLSSCHTLKYDYRGQEHVFFATASLLAGTAVVEPILLNDAADWQTVSYSWNKPKVVGEFSTEEFRRSVIGFTWRLEGYSSVGDFLEVRNVRCE